MHKSTTSNIAADKMEVNEDNVQLHQEQMLKEDLALQMHFGDMSSQISPHQKEQNLIVKSHEPPSEKLPIGHQQEAYGRRGAPPKSQYRPEVLFNGPPYHGYPAHYYHGQPMYHMMPGNQNTHGAYYPYYYIDPMAQYYENHQSGTMGYDNMHVTQQGVFRNNIPRQVSTKAEQVRIPAPITAPVSNNEIVILSDAPEIIMDDNLGEIDPSKKPTQLINDEHPHLPQRMPNYIASNHGMSYPSSAMRGNYQKRRASPYGPPQCSINYQQYPMNYYQHLQVNNEPMEEEEFVQADTVQQPLNFVQSGNNVPERYRIKPVVSLVNVSTVSSAQRFQSRARRQQSQNFTSVPNIDRAPLVHLLMAKANNYKARKMMQLEPNIDTHVQIGATNMKNFNLKENDNIVLPLYRPSMNTAITVTVSGPGACQVNHTTLVLQILIDKPNSNPLTYCWKNIDSDIPLFQDIIPIEGCEVHACGGKITMYSKESCPQIKVKFQFVKVSCKSKAGCMSRFGPLYRILVCHDLLSGNQLIEENNCVFGIINSGQYQVHQEKYTALIERLIGSSGIVKQILEVKSSDKSINEEVALLLNMIERADDLLAT